LLTLYNLS